MQEHPYSLINIHDALPLSRGLNLSNILGKKNSSYIISNSAGYILQATTRETVKKKKIISRVPPLPITQIPSSSDWWTDN